MGEAAVRPALGDPVGHRVVGDRRAVEGGAEAGEALPPDLDEQLVHAAEVGVHGHRRRADLGRQPAGRDGVRALLGEQRAAASSSWSATSGFWRARHLTTIHHGVINNSVIQRTTTGDASMTVDEHVDQRHHDHQQVADRARTPRSPRRSPRSTCEVVGAAARRARRALPAQRAEPDRRRSTRRPTTGSPATAWCTASASRDGQAEWYRNRWVRSTPVSERARRGARARASATAAWTPPTPTSIGLGRADARHRRGRRPARRAVRTSSTRRPQRPRAARCPTATPPTRRSTRPPATLHAIAYHWALPHLQYIVIGADGRRAARSSRSRSPTGRWCTTARSPSGGWSSTTCPSPSTSTPPCAARASRTRGTTTTRARVGLIPLGGRRRRRALVRGRPVLRVPPAQRPRRRRPRRARRRALRPDVRRQPPRSRRRRRRCCGAGRSTPPPARCTRSSSTTCRSSSRASTSASSAAATATGYGAPSVAARRRRQRLRRAARAHRRRDGRRRPSIDLGAGPRRRRVGDGARATPAPPRTTAGC